ncbi:electron transport complex subunit RsxC [bacterium]|nr:electron transport complex subunit RsxC [bacterium]
MPGKHFRGGVHPREEKKGTSHKPIEEAPLPKQVVIPLLQHIGAPGECLVQKGDSVRTGQPLSKPVKFVSVPVHASITGKVTAVEPRPHPLGASLLSVVIEGDGTEDRIETLKTSDDWQLLSVEEIRDRIRDAGIAGLGGASFPTHVKISPPPEKPIRVLILNGAECEPYLTADHRLMLEKADGILTGLRILMKVLNVRRAVIGIEKNKPDAISLMRSKTEKDRTIGVAPLHVKYPQGGEKQLIKAVTGLTVPSGGLPMDVGCLVQNVGTAFSIYEAVCFRKPLFERIVTVTGPGVVESKNLRVRIGTLFSDLIAFCGGYSDETVKVINGGPMMGIAQHTDGVPVLKGTSGILVLDEKSGRMKPESPCISCARCVDGCPMNLMPNRIAGLVEYGRWKDAVGIGLTDCIECGSCAYICPAKRNLVHYIKLGKALNTESMAADGGKK